LSRQVPAGSAHRDRAPGGIQTGCDQRSGGDGANLGRNDQHDSMTAFQRDRPYRGRPPRQVHYDRPGLARRADHPIDGVRQQISRRVSRQEGHPVPSGQAFQQYRRIERPAPQVHLTPSRPRHLLTAQQHVDATAHRIAIEQEDRTGGDTGTETARLSRATGQDCRQHARPSAAAARQHPDHPSRRHVSRVTREGPRPAVPGRSVDNSSPCGQLGAQRVAILGGWPAQRHSSISTRRSSPSRALLPSVDPSIRAA